MAGPVVAAAVIFDEPRIKDKRLRIKDIKDSKMLAPKKREELSKNIRAHCLGWGIGVVEPKVIDEINIHQATLLAMRRAVEKLLLPLNAVIPSKSALADESRNPLNDAHHQDMVKGIPSLAPLGRDDTKKCLLFLDGKFCLPNFYMKQEAVMNGDNKVLSVAAASIIAKVYRDDLMREYHKHYPCYDFARHKGYGTLHHQKMIIKHGLSAIHRVSFCGNFRA